MRDIQLLSINTLRGGERRAEQILGKERSYLSYQTIDIN